MTDFQKTRYCPASEMLLAFVEGGIEAKESAALRRHLEICEFCSAEAEFYTRFSPGELDIYDPGPVPEPLYELAEALLNRESNLAAFYKLVER